MAFKSHTLTRCPRLLCAVLTLIALSVCGANGQEFDPDPGHKEYLTINGVRFSSPNDFETERKKTTEQLVYLPHKEYDLGLFIAASDKTVDEEYIKGLCELVASYLFPKEKALYSWKTVEGYEKVSKFEVGGGLKQGFNGKQRVLVQFRQFRVNGKEVVTGYTFGLGRGRMSKELFEKNLGGNSMPGWYAQAHVIASLTGERYAQINPGGELIIELLPPKKN